MLYERGVSEGLFFLLKTEAKRHKSGQTEQNKGEKRTFAPHLLLSLLWFTCLYCLYTHGRLICFALFVYSICHSKLVGWTWVSLIFLTHYIIGAKTSGYFRRGSVFLSFPLSKWDVYESVCFLCEAVCFVSHVNDLSTCLSSGKILFGEKKRL